MSSKKTEPTDLLLFKIPYVYEQNEMKIISVPSVQAVTEMLKGLAGTPEYGAHYYVLIQGSVIPTAQWAADQVQIFHP